MAATAPHIAEEQQQKTDSFRQFVLRLFLSFRLHLIRSAERTLTFLCLFMCNELSRLSNVVPFFSL